MISQNKALDDFLKKFILSLVIVMAFGVVDVQLAKAKDKKQTDKKVVEEKKEEVIVVVQKEKPTPELTTQSQEAEENNNMTEREEIENYIREKFKEDADKAFLLLKGKGEGTCAENRNLDPNAVNDNTWWGGKGKDYGIFQINSHYHPVFKLNLHKDWKANVDYAYRMYLNDGRTFKRWTCGKVYKI